MKLKKKTKIVIIVMIVLIIILAVVMVINYYKKINSNITEDNGIEFINNKVIIFFNNDVEAERCRQIIAEIGGEVSHAEEFINCYEVTLNEKFFSYDELKQYCEELKKSYKEIQTTTADLVMKVGPA